mgnify:FL=1
MNIGSAAAGYGYEYVASTLDRVKDAALSQSDAMLQMFAAFIAELCGEPCAFGCFRPDEALLSHQLLTGALRAYETGSVVRLD